LQPPAAGALRSHGPVAYVPQDPNSLLFAPTVRRELEQTLRLLGRHDGGAVDAWLERLGLTAMAERHELRGEHHPVLASGQPRDRPARRVWTYFFAISARFAVHTPRVPGAV
jgi:hypothetical protein